MQNDFKRLRTALKRHGLTLVMEPDVCYIDELGFNMTIIRYKVYRNTANGRRLVYTAQNGLDDIRAKYFPQEVQLPADLYMRKGLPSGRTKRSK